jgi:hypothetical protein
MEIKDFFKLALKLIAIFYAVQAVYLIVGNIYYFISTYKFQPVFAVFTLLSTLIPVVVYYLIFVQSDRVVRFLKIDKGFEGQKVHFGNLTSNEILKIAFIIFGLLMIVEGLPDFLTNVFYAFKDSAGSKFYEPNPDEMRYDYFAMTKSGIYILLGYLMLTNYKRIANWFDK